MIGNKINTLVALQNETLKTAFGVQSGSLMINLSYAPVDSVAEEAATTAFQVCSLALSLHLNLKLSLF